MQEKKRLDQILVDEGFFESREKARTAIMSNYVKVNGQIESKPGTLVNLKKLEENPGYIVLEDKSSPYVSRGALKLEKAIQEFKINLKNTIVLDIGSSTGGFTDYCLQNGAKKVFAIDVGKAQLDYKLRQDPRVQSLEGKNFKDLEIEDLDLLLKTPSATDSEAARVYLEKINLVVCDLSFISIIKILDNLKKIIFMNYDFVPKENLLAEADKNNLAVDFIFLIKPQFEAGKKIADKFKGVITDAKIREEIVSEVIKNIESHGFKNRGLAESPIKGAKGNLEYLAHFVF